jgi:hypothetical protein
MTGRLSPRARARQPMRIQAQIVWFAVNFVVSEERENEITFSRMARSCVMLKPVSNGFSRAAAVMAVCRACSRVWK